MFSESLLISGFLLLEQSLETVALIDYVRMWKFRIRYTIPDFKGLFIRVTFYVYYILFSQVNDNGKNMILSKNLFAFHDLWTTNFNLIGFLYFIRAVILWSLKASSLMQLELLGRNRVRILGHIDPNLWTMTPKAAQKENSLMKF